MSNIKLLIVDDEKRFLLTTNKILTRKGFDVLTTDSGQGAMDMLADHAVQIVVLDVRMPGMDGLATLREIKRRHPSTEVIMLTGHATVPSAVEGMQSGAADYLMKPINMDLLVEKVEEAVARRREAEKNDDRPLPGRSVPGVK
jgi:DNA-binding NtrC family response regulator